MGSGYCSALFLILTLTSAKYFRILYNIIEHSIYKHKLAVSNIKISHLLKVLKDTKVEYCSPPPLDLSSPQPNPSHTHQIPIVLPRALSLARLQTAKYHRGLSTLKQGSDQISERLKLTPLHQQQSSDFSTITKLLSQLLAHRASSVNFPILNL